MIKHVVLDKISVRCRGDIQVALSSTYLALKALSVLTTRHWLYKPVDNTRTS